MTIPEEIKEETQNPAPSDENPTPESAKSEDLAEKSPETAEKPEKDGKGEDESDKKSEKKYKKECAELRQKLENAEKASKEASDKYLRLVAEYDNFRKRSAKEKEGIYADAYTDALKAILPVIDNLERAVAFTEGEKVIEGVKMTLNQFSAALEKMGVEEIPAETFDPNVHNAVMHVQDESLGEGQIVEVFQKGYRKGDKIIRFAMVKVAN